MDTRTLPAFSLANADAVTPRLWVGGDLDTTRPALAVRQLGELCAAGLTTIVDVRLEWSDELFVERLAPDVRYRHLGVDDAGQRMPDRWFDEGTRVVLESLAEPAPSRWSTATWGSTVDPRSASRHSWPWAGTLSARSTPSAPPADRLRRLRGGRPRLGAAAERCHTVRTRRCVPSAGAVAEGQPPLSRRRHPPDSCRRRGALRSPRGALR